MKKGTSVIIALLLLVAGALMLCYTFGVFDIGKNYIKTTATITSIEYSSHNDSHYVYVTFEVDGEKFENIKLDTYDASMSEGNDVSIKYNADNPNDIKSNSAFGLWVMGIFGVVLFAMGSVSLVQMVKAKAEQNSPYSKYAEGYDNENTSKLFANIPSDDSAEQTKHYYFHYSGKMNQGNILEDENHTPIYEAVQTKFNLLSDCQFEFINHLTGETIYHLVGKTVTTSTGGRNWDVVTGSYFSLDNVNIWQYLNGIGIDYASNKSITNPVYTVLYNGKAIGTLTNTGTNLFENEKQHLVGNIPVEGFYRVDTKDCYVNIVFLVAFTLAHTERTIRSY